MNPNIQFIYFDIGGVFFKWDRVFSTIAEEFGLEQTSFLDLFDEIDEQITKGEMTSAQFWQLAQQRFGITNGESYQFAQNWVGDYVPIHAMHSFASKVSKQYSIGVISNFYTELYPISLEQGKVPNLPFNPAIISCDVHMRKPESEMYQYAEELCKVDPTRILFIDDSESSIQGAKERGWQTHLFATYEPESSINALKTLLNLR